LAQVFDSVLVSAFALHDLHRTKVITPVSRYHPLFTSLALLNVLKLFKALISAMRFNSWIPRIYFFLLVY